jgi:hypothetical protein
VAFNRATSTLHDSHHVPPIQPTFKDGKEHRYWNIVENERCAGGKVVQRQVLYLGEINDGQREAWCELIDAFDEGSRRHHQLALFPADREVPACAEGHGVQVRLEAMELHRPDGCRGGSAAQKRKQRLSNPRRLATSQQYAPNTVSRRSSRPTTEQQSKPGLGSIHQSHSSSSPIGSPLS